MIIKIPSMSLVLLIGASGSGKSTFARTHFLPTEVVSSDTCRALVSDDENNQAASSDAFELLHTLVGLRLKRGLLTVVDATSVQAAARKNLLQLAAKYHVMPVAIVFDLPEDVAQARNKLRPDRDFGPHVIRNQTRDLKSAIRALRKEGFRYHTVLKSEDEVNSATIERSKLWTDKREETGPFDIIGDVHGCLDELRALLAELGYAEVEGVYQAPEGRKAIFVGDLVDRGPDSPGVLRLVKAMVEADQALCVPGNHDVKLVRKLKGGDFPPKHGLAETLEQLSKCDPEEVAGFTKFIDGLVSHYVLDDGKLVVAHAGMSEALQGRPSASVREFALYGETTGEIDEYGLPVRVKWAEEYRGDATVVYGHTPMVEAEWLNKTVCIDTGCVFGGKLTALRYPERELVSVPAARVYSEPIRPLADPQTLTSQQIADDLLDVQDVRGRQHIRTENFGTIVIPEEQAAAAFEVMGRFAADPRWLVYLPPTMSPSETSSLPDFLEHPLDALDYYAGHGIKEIVAEEKHMGSRAVVIVGRDEEAIFRGFAISGWLGIVLTRTGRPFFENRATEQVLLQRFSEALAESGFWDRHEAGWAVFDCELMPWSAKAQGLLRSQYAPVGATSRASLGAQVEILCKLAGRLDTLEAQELLASTEHRLDAAQRYTDAYRRYCWPIQSVDDYRLAPFQILAVEGKALHGEPHLWHMQEIARACEHEPILVATKHRVVRTDDPADRESLADWWLSHTEAGGEGLVIKGPTVLTRGNKHLVQPALKSRGREYLRIIYGPDYLEPGNLQRLKKRGLGTKRALAMREYVLGLEALRRFLAGEPLRRVHQCTFGVLALESEPVDPRL